VLSNSTTGSPADLHLEARGRRHHHREGPRRPQLAAQQQPRGKVAAPHGQRRLGAGDPRTGGDRRGGICGRWTAAAGQRGGGSQGAGERGNLSQLSQLSQRSQRA
jgi:hypothetical protein